MLLAGILAPRSKPCTSPAGKIQVLEALLKAVRSIEPTDKVVIVSNYTESLDLLKQVGYLGPAAAHPTILTGNQCCY